METYASIIGVSYTEQSRNWTTVLDKMFKKLNEEIIKTIICINLENLKLEVCNWDLLTFNFTFDTTGHGLLVRKHTKER